MAPDMIVTTLVLSFMGTSLLTCYQPSVRHSFLKGGEVFGNVLLSSVFTVTKINFAKGRLVLFLSNLNSIIKNYKFRMLTLTPSG